MAKPKAEDQLTEWLGPSFGLLISNLTLWPLQASNREMGSLTRDRNSPARLESFSEPVLWPEAWRVLFRPRVGYEELGEPLEHTGR